VAAADDSAQPFAGMGASAITELRAKTPAAA
jgi:hypothetical protein